MILPKNKKNGSQSGQALIIILLAMSVALTLVLSSVSRSVTDVRITSEEQDSLRAFSAAEAGIEEVLLQLSRSGSSTGAFGQFGSDGPEYDADIITGSVGSHYEYPKDLDSGESATFWLVGHGVNGEFDCTTTACTRPANMKVCFGSGSYSTVPAIQVQIFYDDTATSASDFPDSLDNNDLSTVKMHTLAYDPNSGRISGGSLSTQSGSDACADFTYQTHPINNPVIPCQNNRICVLSIKVKSLFTNQQLPVALSISGGGQTQLPAQGVTISSRGTAGETERRLEAEYVYSSIPSVFDNTVFSGGDIVQ